MSAVIKKYAVIKDGGKQYRVNLGKILKLERLTAEPGNTVNLAPVLLLAEDGNIQVGKPCLTQAKVVAEVLKHGRNKKIEIIKFKRRKKYLRQQGHRQHYTQVKITDIIST